MITENSIREAQKDFIQIQEEALMALAESIRKDLVHQENTAFDQLKALPFWRFLARRRLKDRIDTLQASRFIVTNAWVATSASLRKEAEEHAERLLQQAKKRAVSAKGPKLRITHGKHSVLLQ